MVVTHIAEVAEGTKVSFITQGSTIYPYQRAKTRHHLNPNSPHWLYPTTTNLLHDIVYCETDLDNECCEYQTRWLLEKRGELVRYCRQRVKELYYPFADNPQEDREAWGVERLKPLCSALALMENTLPVQCAEGEGWRFKYDGVSYIYIPASNALREKTVESSEYIMLILEFVDLQLNIAEARRNGRAWKQLSDNIYAVKDKVRRVWEECGVGKDLW